ncbi:L-type lectin-domain containing receptor kinase IX.1-like [Cornus florida]|uniref:L-type lectin-domain containing receptor kinase IX.1-like n=1 Tax=Cornus florida TaxID=4283 RepID=UPI00289D9A0D|nr:L-type lectin-domain containing receptor kinase IX.1-like [Cornus florida]
MEILKYDHTHRHFPPYILFGAMSKISVFLFLLITPFAKPLSHENTTFGFNSFNPNMHDISYEGDAYSSNQVISLTKYLKASVGRATYREPIKLWDIASGNLADFNTHFSFLINSRNASTGYSGFAFFLAPFGSHLLPNSGNSHLGLVGTNTTNVSFVAVEFDTYSTPGPWDFQGSDHVGIDVNSLSSVEAVEWSWSDGQRAKAWISYNSSSKNLSVLVNDDQMASSSSTSNSTSLSYIVDLKMFLPELVTIGFSGASGSDNDGYETYNIISWDFSSTLKSAENVTNMISGRKKNKIWLWIYIMLGVGACFVVPALVWFGCWMERNKSKTESGRMERNNKRNTENNPMPADYELERVEVLPRNFSCQELERVEVPRNFSYWELEVATNSFADERLLGRGGFGRVYKGVLSDTESSVAVKKIIPESRQGMKEYVSEVQAISRLRHKNLVKLIGWCHDQDQELLIVYDFMPNKSLDFHLFKETRLLKWEERYRIALGLASALVYMQEDCEQCVLHRDIKSSNVLLDSNFNAKLGDFGLARLVEHGKESQTTDLIGTPGYMAPEYHQNRKATKKSDIYSFGIVALEIACGKHAIEHGEAKGKKVVIELVKAVWGHYGNRNFMEAGDPKLGREYDVEQMKRLIVVGLWCAHPDYSSRPSIKEVMDVLNSKAPLPDLPSAMPVSTFIPLPVILSSSNGASGSERGQPQYSGNSGNTDSSNYRSFPTASGGS